MKKRFSAWLSMVLVMVLVTSFSFPVQAGEVSDEVSGEMVSFSDVCISLDEFGFPSLVEDEDDLSLSDADEALLSSAAARAVSYIGTSVKPSQIFYTSLTAGLDYVSGDYYPATNDVILGLITNEFWGNGFYVYSTGIYYDFRNALRSGRYDSVALYLSSFSFSFTDYSVSSSWTSSNGSYFLALGPYIGISDMSDLVSLHMSPERAYVPFSDLPSSGVCRLYIVRPFSCHVPNPYACYATATYSVALDSVTSVKTGIGSVTTSDIYNQTTSINNQISQETQAQTDTLTNGYDGSGMNADNDRLSSSLESYDDAESQVTDQSNAYIDAVTFFDPTTHLQLMACVTYAATFLQGLFVALGDWSVLVMLALSLAFALMLIGWFKYRK